MFFSVLSSKIFFDKAYIKPGIMRYKARLAYKLHKLRQNRLDIRRIHDHRVCYTRKLCNLEWDRNLRIYKGTVAIYNLPMLHLYCSDLNDSVSDRAKPCCLNIEHYKRIIQSLISRANRNLCQIIYQIAFHPIDHLERIVLIQCFNIMIGIRERLNYSVICNRNCPMSPIVCTFHNIFYLRHAIHITHFCMAMKLYTLHRTCVHSCRHKVRYLFNACHRADGQLSIKLVDRCHALDLQKRSFFDLG